jgi:hypothetical protein
MALMGHFRTLNKKPTPLTFLSKVDGAQSVNWKRTLTYNERQHYQTLLSFGYCHEFPAN